MTTADRTPLVTRLDRLEQENRRWRFLGLAAVVCAACLPFLAWTQATATSQPSKLAVTRASKFVLVGIDGKARAELRIQDGAPGLFLIDAAGKTRVRLGFAKDDPVLILRDKTAKKRLGLTVDGTGAAHVVLSDKFEHPRAHLVTSARGGPGLVMTDGEGHRRAGIGIDLANKPWLLPGANRSGQKDK